MKRVLAIGGSDSGGGAGLQADLKALHGLGVHVSTVVTAITAQDTTAVHSVLPTPVGMVQAQLHAVLSEIGADVVKTGMLATAATVQAVVDAVRGLPLVVDPVGASSTGQPLLEPEALALLRSELLPLALVVTPNLDEVRSLTGVEVRAVDDLLAAAQAMHALGPRWVLIKGGHLPGDPIDLLYDGTTALELRGERIDTPHTHGTGCTLAAALAGWVALGLDVPEAARKAKALTAEAIRHGYPLGAGPGPVRAGGTSVRGHEAPAG